VRNPNTANSDLGNGSPAKGPTKTQEAASDSRIDAENVKADQKVKSICKGC
jgi:hypothetical protein